MSATVSRSGKQVKFKRGRAATACQVCHMRKVRCNMGEEFPCGNCKAFKIECIPREGRSKRKKNPPDGNSKPKPAINGTRKRVESSDLGSISATETSASASFGPEDTHSAGEHLSSGFSTIGGADSERIGEHGGNSVGGNSNGSTFGAFGSPTSPSSTGTSSSIASSASTSSATNSNANGALLKKLQEHVRVKGTARQLSDAKPGYIAHRMFEQSTSANVLRSLIGTSTVGEGGGILEEVLVQRVLHAHSEQSNSCLAATAHGSLQYALLLPSPEVSDHLIDIYFKYVHPYIPVINRREFLKQYRIDRDSPSILLRQAIYSAATRLSSHPDLMDAQGSSSTAALEFYHRAKALFDINFENSIMTLVLSSLVLAQTVDDPMFVNQNAFFWVRLGITLAQGMSLHRHKYGADVHSEQQRRRRIVWWCLYKRDIASSMAFGRPAMINLEDCDVDMITEEDFVSSEGPIVPGNSASVLANTFIQSVKLHEILALILRMQYTVGAERLRQLNVLLDATQCDRALAEWVTQLPDVLDLNKGTENSGTTNGSTARSNGSRAKTSAEDGSSAGPHKRKNGSIEELDVDYTRRLLYLEYYTVVCLLHRPQVAHLFQLGGDKSYPIWGIAFQAANMVLQLMESFSKQDLVRMLPGFAVYACFSAVILLSFQRRASINPSVRTSVSNALNRFHAISKILSKSHHTGSWVMFFTEELQNPKLTSRIVRGFQQSARQPEMYYANTTTDTSSTGGTNTGGGTGNVDTDTTGHGAASAGANTPSTYYSDNAQQSEQQGPSVPVSTYFPESKLPPPPSNTPKFKVSPQPPSQDQFASNHAGSTHLASVQSQMQSRSTTPQVGETLGSDSTKQYFGERVETPDYVQKMFPGDDLVNLQFHQTQSPLDLPNESSPDDDAPVPNTMNMADWYNFLTQDEDTPAINSFW